MPLDWWPEAAMFHGISFQDGRVTGYRNRWARTQRWANVHDPDLAPSLLDTNPNVSVLRHAGEILALSDGGAPLAITAELETLGATRRHLDWQTGMTAHPKVDPQTGELITFRADWKKPFLRYGVTDAKGKSTFYKGACQSIPLSSIEHRKSVHTSCVTNTAHL